MTNKKTKFKTIIWSSDEDGAKVLHIPESGKDLQQDPQVLVHEKSGLPRLAQFRKICPSTSV